MKNKQIRGSLCLLAAVMLCFSVPCTVYGDSDGAVIVEDSAIIGGEVQQPVPRQPSQPVVQPSQPVMNQQPVAKPEKKDETGKESAQPQEKKQPAKEESKAPEQKNQKAETVSQNRIPRKAAPGKTFVVPKNKGENIGKTETEVPEQDCVAELPEEAPEVNGSKSDSPEPVSLPFLLAGIVCLGAGIARIIRRLLVAYGKL